MDEVEICQAEIRRLRSVVRELQNKDFEYNYIFVLGYDLLQNFLSEKPCECDAAFEFCKIVYNLFLASEYNKQNKPEYDCLKEYVERLSYEELDELYWTNWSSL